MRQSTRRDILVLSAASVAGIGLAAAAGKVAQGATLGNPDSELLRLFRRWNDADRAHDEYTDIIEARWEQTLPLRPPMPDTHLGIKRWPPHRVPWEVAVKQCVAERDAIEERFGIPAMKAKQKRMLDALHAIRKEALTHTPRTLAGVAATLRMTFFWPPFLGDGSCAAMAVDSEMEAVWTAVQALEAMGSAI